MLISFPLGEFAEPELVGLSLFQLWGISTLSSTTVTKVYSPTNWIFGDIFLLASIIFWFLDGSSSDWDEVKSHGDFYVRFTDSHWSWALFSCVSWLFLLHALKNICSCHEPLSSLDCFCFLGFLSSLYLLAIKPLSGAWIANISSHSIDWLPDFIDGFVPYPEASLV